MLTLAAPYPGPFLTGVSGSLPPRIFRRCPPQPFRPRLPLPSPLLFWLLKLGPDAMRFERWLDTQLTMPGQPDRTCDTIAHISRLDQGGVPWAIPIEFQVEPDAIMFGRSLVYEGLLYQLVKPFPERGDRFCLMSVVVNLTGSGNSGGRMVWREGGPETTLMPEELNLSELKAEVILEAIARGEVPRIVLCWIPLMKNGGDPAIIQRWLEIASAETDPRARADYALARVFAEAVDSQDVWNKALQRWNVKESHAVLEWINEGKADMLVRMLRGRLGTLPEEIATRIRNSTDSAQLDRWADQLATATTLDEVRSRLNS